MSQITTHVLDTSKGSPAQGIPVNLLRSENGQWQSIGNGTTNSDGRISDLLSLDTPMAPGRYRLDFMLEAYFKSNDLPCFYPEASVVFNIEDESHYHIPLLLSPYGYSTYRGS